MTRSTCSSLAKSWRDLALPEADRAMLAYVELLVLTPNAAREDHVAALRRVGFGDAEIFEIVMVTAYYALRCRMADGLGVELDTRVKRDATLVEAFAYRNKTDHRAARLGDSTPSNRSSLAAPMIAQGL